MTTLLFSWLIWLFDPFLFQLDEIDVEAAPPQPPWNGNCSNGHGGGGGVFSSEPPQPEHFFQALGCVNCTVFILAKLLLEKGRFLHSFWQMELSFRRGKIINSAFAPNKLVFHGLSRFVLIMAKWWLSIYESCWTDGKYALANFCRLHAVDVNQPPAPPPGGYPPEWMA